MDWHCKFHIDSKVVQPNASELQTWHAVGCSWLANMDGRNLMKGRLGKDIRVLVIIHGMDCGVVADSAHGMDTCMVVDSRLGIVGRVDVDGGLGMDPSVLLGDIVDTDSRTFVDSLPWHGQQSCRGQQKCTDSRRIVDSRRARGVDLSWIAGIASVGKLLWIADVVWIVLVPHVFSLARWGHMS